MTLHEAIRRGLLINDTAAIERIDARINDLEKELLELQKRRNFLNDRYSVGSLYESMLDEKA